MRDEYLIETNELGGNIQRVYKFKNHYGASVFKPHYMELWEVALLLDGELFYSEELLDFDFMPKGNVDENQVDDILLKIEGLT